MNGSKHRSHWAINVELTWKQVESDWEKKFLDDSPVDAGRTALARAKIREALDRLHAEGVVDHYHILKMPFEVEE